MTHSFHLELPDLQDGYLTLVEEVLKGDEVSPRGQRTKECLASSFTVLDPTKAVPVGVGRKLNTALGAAETAQLIAGVSDAAQFVAVAPNYADFVERGRLHGGYGPRVHSQFPGVIASLTRDPASRQAGVVIWRPYDLATPTKDVPCTVELQYMIREGRLEAFTFMRSNDVFWGVPYDVWMFTAVQRALAHALGVEAGPYHHVANSLHAYVDRDSKYFSELHAYDGTPQPPAPIPSVGLVRYDQVPSARWESIVARMEGVVGQRNVWHRGIPEVEWYADKLRPSLSGGLLCSSCRYVLPRTREFFKANRLERAGGRITTSSCVSCERGRGYGLKGNELEALITKQRGLCAGCGELPLNGRWAGFAIDHDHATGAVRGLLCSKCNGVLAYVQDRSSVLQGLQDYLHEPPYAVMARLGV